MLYANIYEQDERITTYQAYTEALAKFDDIMQSHEAVVAEEEEKEVDPEEDDSTSEGDTRSKIEFALPQDIMKALASIGSVGEKKPLKRLRGGALKNATNKRQAINSQP